MDIVLNWYVLSDDGCKLVNVEQNWQYERPSKKHGTEQSAFESTVASELHRYVYTSSIFFNHCTWELVLADIVPPVPRKKNDFIFIVDTRSCGSLPNLFRYATTF